ncbi:MAG: DUF1616 domain-containing protein [Candidatus Nezhaarchaeota archaeon]|nr:DUF1616 domain-containing protein [Candidatus Nezhaarchaeota archaeon]
MGRRRARQRQVRAGGEVGRGEERILEVLERHGEVRLEDAVSLCQQALKLRREDVAKSIYYLSQRGLVTLEDPSPPSSFVSYLTNHRSAWFWAIVLLVALTSQSIYLFPQVPPVTYVRYALGSLFVLYLPGYALVEALYPRREDLTPLERLALSIGLSLALVPLIGLVLNYTPWGIRLNPVFTALSLTALGLSTVALVRKYAYSKSVAK